MNGDAVREQLARNVGAAIEESEEWQRKAQRANAALLTIQGIVKGAAHDQVGIGHSEQRLVMSDALIAIASVIVEWAP